MEIFKPTGHRMAEGVLGVVLFFVILFGVFFLCGFLASSAWNYIVVPWWPTLPVVTWWQAGVVVWLLRVLTGGK